MTPCWCVVAGPWGAYEAGEDVVAILLHAPDSGENDLDDSPAPTILDS